MEHIFIFTYGTLMEGRRNYEKYLKGRVKSAKKAYVKGSLYHLENKNYPGFITEGDEKVYGQILEIENDEKLIAALDDLESCQAEDYLLNEYIKEELDIYTEDDELFARLPVYVYNRAATVNKDDELIRVDTGYWIDYLRLSGKISE